MPYPSWTRTEIWDQVFLAGVRVPGIARVDINRRCELNKKKAKGHKRARVSGEGVDVADVTISLTFVDETEIDAFEATRARLMPRSKTADVQPVAFAHPLGAWFEVSAVVVKAIAAATPTAGGAFQVQINAVEWVPEAPKVKKKTGSDQPTQSEHDDDWSVQPQIDALNESGQLRAVPGF